MRSRRGGRDPRETRGPRGRPTAAQPGLPAALGRPGGLLARIPDLEDRLPAARPRDDRLAGQGGYRRIRGHAGLFAVPAAGRRRGRPARPQADPDRLRRDPAGRRGQHRRRRMGRAHHVCAGARGWFPRGHRDRVLRRGAACRAADARAPVPALGGRRPERGQAERGAAGRAGARRRAVRAVQGRTVRRRRGILPRLPGDAPLHQGPDASGSPGFARRLGRVPGWLAPVPG